MTGTKWVYCEMCEEVVKRRFHSLMHVVALSLALKLDTAGRELYRRRR